MSADNAENNDSTNNTDNEAGKPGAGVWAAGAAVAAVAVHAAWYAVSLAELAGVPRVVPAALLAFWLLSAARGSLLTVRTGHRVVVERLGTYSRTVGPGLHLLVPLLERPRCVRWTRLSEDPSGRVRTETKTDWAVPVGETSFDLPPVRVTTSDRLDVTVNAVLFFRVVDVRKASYGVDDLWNAIGLLMSTSLRKAVSGMPFEEARRRGDEIRRAVWRDFEERSARWGVEISELDLQSVDASAALTAATERLVQSQREAQAHVARAQAEREAAMVTAQAEAERRRLHTDTEAEVTRSAARAARDRAVLEAEGHAAHVRALLEAGATPEYLVQREHTEAWKALAASSNKVVVPYDAARFLGAAQLVAGAGQRNGLGVLAMD